MTNERIETHVPCEVCGSSDAKCVYADGHGYCFSCGHYYPPDKEFQDLEYTYEYLPWRSVSKDTMRFYDIKTKIDSGGAPISIGFLYPNGAYKVRSLEQKHFFSLGEISKAGLFGRNLFTGGSNRYVIITEGELDAASLHQVLQVPVVSVQSATSAVRDATLDRSWLNSFERIYLAFDGDAAGRDATAGVARLFDYDKIFDLRFDGVHKDPNDFLQAGATDELRTVFANAKHYLPENIKSTLAEFDSILEKTTKRGVPYPFHKLTEMTYGMRKGETVLITAQEGVGKTELVHAIEYQLLTETDDNVGCFFLEEPDDRHLQSLAGIRLKRPAHLPDSGCSDSEIRSALRSVVGRDDRLHLYSLFGADDPDVLADSIRFLVTARGCGWICFDHLSMAFSGDSEMDERRSIDRFCTKLQVMVKNLGFGMILVCHVNDLNQTRSSRWPAKIADVRIHATRDLDSGSNVVHLMLKDKNRLVGKTGAAGSYAFDLTTRQYTQIGDEHGGHNDNYSQRASNDNTGYSPGLRVA